MLAHLIATGNKWKRQLPASMILCPCVVSVLGYRLRRRQNFKPALGQWKIIVRGRDRQRTICVMHVVSGFACEWFAFCKSTVVISEVITILTRLVSRKCSQLPNAGSRFGQCFRRETTIYPALSLCHVFPVPTGTDTAGKTVKRT